MTGLTTRPPKYTDLAPLCVIPEGVGPVKGLLGRSCGRFRFLRRSMGERQRGVGVQDRPEADREAAVGPGGPRRAGGSCSARRRGVGVGAVPVGLLAG